MLNRFTFNGSVLNGQPLAPILAASLVLSASAGLSADAHIVKSTTATVAAAATATAQPLHTHAGVAYLSDNASLSAIPTHHKSATASASASATLIAFIERTQSADAYLLATAQMSAWPEAVQGAASLSASATLTAEGERRRTVPLHSAVALAAAEITPPATHITRGAWIEGSVLSRASLHAQGDVQRSGETVWERDGFAYPKATATLTLSAAGVRVFNAPVVFTATAQTTAEATRCHCGGPVTRLAASVQVSATPHIRHDAEGAFSATAGLSPVGVRTAFAQAQMDAGATATSQAVHLHRAASHSAATATVAAQATRIRSASAQHDVACGAMAVEATREVRPTATLQGTASVFLDPMLYFTLDGGFTGTATLLATATREVRPSAALSGTATMTAAPTRVRPATATLSSAATVQIAGLTQMLAEAVQASGVATLVPGATRVRPGAATGVSQAAVVPVGAEVVNVYLWGDMAAQGAAQLTATPTRTTYSTGAADAQATLWAYGETRNIYAFAEATLHGTAALDANSVTNAESVDPPWRTFARPATVTEFRRPARTTEFRRGVDWAREEAA